MKTDGMVSNTNRQAAVFCYSLIKYAFLNAWISLSEDCLKIFFNERVVVIKLEHDYLWLKESGLITLALPWHSSEALVQRS